jgi:hypothetical protein
MLPLHAIPQLPPLLTSLRTFHRTMKFLPSDNTENFQLNNIHSIYFYRFTEQVILWLLFGRCWFGYQPSTCYADWRFKESTSLPPDRCRGDASNGNMYFVIRHSLPVMPLAVILIYYEILKTYSNKQNSSFFQITSSITMFLNDISLSHYEKAGNKKRF